MTSKKILKVEIYDSQGKLHETQLLDFYADDENTIVITIGNNTYMTKSNGEYICRGTKSFTPYD